MQVLKEGIRDLTVAREQFGQKGYSETSMSDRFRSAVGRKVSRNIVFCSKSSGKKQESTILAANRATGSKIQ